MFGKTKICSKPLAALQRLQRLQRNGFTLVELLVAISIVGIFLSMLLPAAQKVRESARRIQCADHTAQQTLAMHNYQSANGHFPPAFSHPGMTMWSGFILPFLDQVNLYEAVAIEGPWQNDSGATEANVLALGKFLRVFRCPSAAIPTTQFDPIANAVRAPSCYLACASGINNRESGAKPWVGMNAEGDLPASDGIFFLGSKIGFEDIIDGSSSTVLLGEALPDQDLFGDDYLGNSQKVDHWYIGSGELKTYAQIGETNSCENSECLGSTACRINSIKIADSPINDKELSFGSAHNQGANIGFADGHTRFVNESIDAGIWSALGTRRGGEVVGGREL